MNLHPTHITLNNESIIINSLTNINESNDWIDFLKEWYNTESFILVNTSGTTGKPKTIKLEKTFVAASAIRTINYFGLKKNDKILHCLPTKFIAGKLMIVRALIGELNIYIVPADSDFAILKNNEFKFSAMVINQVEKLFSLGISWNIENLLIGGSAIPVNLEEKLQLVSCNCFSSYAMTETATHIALRKLNKERSNIYTCLNNITVSINSNNCLCINMPNSYSVDTNDIAEIYDDKNFKIIGRIDNCIISGGMKFHPELIELKLNSDVNIPFYITSKNHNTLGKQIILVALGNENEFGFMIEKAISKLSKYERPKMIIWKDKFEFTETGKIKRENF